ncbi:MAG: S41 family peptidase [Bacteroidia bacterium]|nr:S41 family peptidase [Bacteroidia bacterium]
MLLILLSFPLTSFGQKEMSKKEILIDFRIFKDILAQGHPNLYEYTSQMKWDSLFRKFEKERVNQITDSDDLFRDLSHLADQARDGHLQLLHPEMKPIPPMFPLLLKVIDEKLFADTDDFEIPIGSEILEINGIGSPEILSSLLKYAPSDGYSLPKKYRQVEKEFGILHLYEYGSQENYTVSIQRPDGIPLTKEIAPQSFSQIGNRYPKRNSHFAKYHQSKDPTAYFMQRMAEQWPFVYYIDSINAAVLTVHSFGFDPVEFKSRLIGLFKEIRKRKSTNLIIDVRQNPGGYRINAIHLFSFLTKEPFQQRVAESVITEKLPYKEHIIYQMGDFEDFFRTYFVDGKKKKGGIFLYEDHSKAEMLPSKKAFKGKTFVLTGGNTFSAASAFALNAKNTSEIKLVGEETGGGYYCHTGQFPVVYELPNSGIRLRMSLVKIDHYVLDQSVSKGSGVLPDMKVDLSLEDLIQGKDSQLDFVIQLLMDK